MANRLDNFIPEIWSGNLLFTKTKSLVYGGLANRKYEGLIRASGDRVKINQMGPITISSYTKNSTSAISTEFLADGQIWLDIDQAKYFAFKVDDVDKAQSDIGIMTAAMDRAAYALNDTADQYLAGLHSQAGLLQGTTAITIKSSNVEAEFLKVGQVMDEANASRASRFAVIPPWLVTKITIAYWNKVTDNKPAYDNGFVGRAYGFDFYVSNNVVKSSTSNDACKIISGIPGESFSFAEQIMNVEAIRDPNSFSDIIRGLNVYGGRIVQADVTAVATFTYAAES